MDNSRKSRSAPWFKFFASDFMMDRDVDELPLEAVGLLIKIWSVMWLEGGIPDSTEEIARKCRVMHLHVQKHMQSLMQFFYKDVSGLLMSYRMEAERVKSSITSKARADSAKLRWKKPLNAIAYANINANANAKLMQSESESESDIKKEKATPPQAAFKLPSDVPKEQWDFWIEMRKNKRTNPTDHAKELAVKKLRELQAQGHPMAAVLDQSTACGYQGLFPLKQDAKKPQNGNGNYIHMPTVKTTSSDGRQFKDWK